MANRFAQYALPQPAPPPQFVPSNRFGHYVQAADGFTPDPAADPKTRYNDAMILKYGPQQWSAAQAQAQENAGKRSGPERSLLNGTLMNFLPEVTAYPVGAVVSARNAIARATGGKPGAYSGDAYRDAIIQAEHDDQDQWAAKHPIANTVLNIAGSLPTLEGLGAGKFIKGADTFGGATLRSGFVGGTTGAASGAGENYGDRGQGALWGGLSGTAFGLGVPSAVAAASKAPELLPRGAAAVKQATGSFGRSLGLPAPEVSTNPASDAQATRFLRKVAASRGVTPDSIQADPRVQAGLPVRAANLLGKRGVNLATGLAKGPGDAPDILDPAAREQIRSTAPGVVSDFQNISGIDPSAAHGDVVQMAAEGRAKAAPLYDQAYSIGGVDSPVLRGLLTRPSVQSAMNRAVRIAAEEGRNPTELGFRWDTQQFPGGKTTVMDQVPSPVGGLREVPREVDLPPVNVDVPMQVQNPTMQTWDYVKRGLDDVLNAKRDPTTRRLNLDEEGRAILGTLNNLRGELTNPDTAWGPDYKAALDAGGDPIRLEQAFNEGGNLMANNVKQRDFQTRWNTYSPAEQQAFMGGFADDINNKLSAGKLRPNDLTTPLSQYKLTTMLGDSDKADDFLNRVQMRADLAKEAGRYSPNTNSTTGEAKSANEEMDTGAPFWAELAKKPNMEGVFGALGNLVSAPIRGAITGFGAPLSPEARLSFAKMMMSDPDTFSSMLSGASKPPTVPSVVPPSVAPSAGLLGGASAYGMQVPGLLGGAAAYGADEQPQ